MKLLTKELEKRFAKVGSQEGKGDRAIIIAKFFHPVSSWKWYATEYFPEDRAFFGVVDGHEVEWGYFSLDELESTELLGLGMERDLYWKETAVREIKFRAGSLA